MTFVMVTAIYPLHQAEKLGKAFTGGKAPETADFVKRINIFVVADFDVKIYVLYEMPDDKLFEGLKSILKNFKRNNIFIPRGVVFVNAKYKNATTSW